MYSKSLTKKEVKEEVLKTFYDKAPNCLLIEHIYNHLGSDIPLAVLEDALNDLEEEGLLTQSRDDTNRREAFQNARRRAYYLTEYPVDYPYEKIIQIGNITLPRLIDTDSARAEDVNQLTEVVKKYSDDIREKINDEVKKEISHIYSQLIVIFGVFVSIFALIVISAEKLITFDPQVINTNNYLQLFLKSTVLLSPVAIIIVLLLLLIWLFTRQ